MNAHAYTEDQLVEQPPIVLFADLGWQTASAKEGVFGPSGTLGRETPSEVVLVPRLRAALEKLNPQLLPEASASAVEKPTRALLLPRIRSRLMRLARASDWRSTARLRCCKATK